VDRKIFDANGIEVWSRNGRYFIRYDAGAHQEVIREDEVSEREATRAMRGVDSAEKVLFAIQARLLKAGIDPYVSNVKQRR
jgi:hypothetical protein